MRFPLLCRPLVMLGPKEPQQCPLFPLSDVNVECFVVSRLSQKTQDLARFVQTLNYDMYWHFSRLYYPDNFYSNPQNDYGEDTILHILAVPHVDGSSIEGLEPVVVPPA